MELPENININEHAIELIEGKQPLYGPIYSLGPMELEMLKAYIETHWKTGFIQASKFLVDVPIFLISSLMEVYDYVLITETSITWRLKIVILYH